MKISTLISPYNTSRSCLRISLNVGDRQTIKTPILPSLRTSDDDKDETTCMCIVLKLVIAENTQVENFINDHNGPGLQHIGLHTSDMIKTVDKLAERGVRFRQPPPTYYTEVC